MHLERLFSAGSLRPQDSMRFVVAGSAQEPLQPYLLVPDDWSLEAAQSFTEALCPQAPESRHTIEENTLPSWLWRHEADPRQTQKESSVLEVFDRIAGAATYRGWKCGLWQDEVSASVFYDELYAALLTRRLVLAPKDMACVGLDWAYGFKAGQATARHATPRQTQALILQNDTIDSLLRKTQPCAQNKWESYLAQSLTKPMTPIAFADTIAQWGALAGSYAAPRALINLMKFRMEDGQIDTTGLEQTTKLAILLLELCYEEIAPPQDKGRPLALGFAQLGALLLSLALPYDSEKARGTAASLTAIITAAAFKTSALIASRLGSCVAFEKDREGVLRSLRNMVRASFGEKNDYDRLSVLPKGLEIESGASLVLISKARYHLEESLRLIQQHGLRHTQVTSLFQSSDCAALMDSTSTGIEAEGSLTCDYAIGGDLFERRMRPSIAMALEAMDYEISDLRAVRQHLEGYRTLKAAPAINHTLLRDKGFDNTMIERVETVLPFVGHLSMAVTPWVIGRESCLAKLNLSTTDLNNPSFDLLHALGFTSKDIEIANGFCCGHETLKGLLDLRLSDMPVFETQNMLMPEATLKMASAVQPFITGDVEAYLSVPASLSAELRSALVLQAWEMGLKTLTLEINEPYRNSLTSENVAAIKRTTPSLRTGETIQPPHETLAKRALKSKAPSRATSAAQHVVNPTASKGT